jgi:hypothetical protein
MLLLKYLERTLTSPVFIPALISSKISGKAAFEVIEEIINEAISITIFMRAGVAITKPKEAFQCLKYNGFRPLKKGVFQIVHTNFYHCKNAHCAYSFHSHR